MLWIFCGPLAICPNSQRFRTCGGFLADTYDSLRLFSIYLRNLRCFGFVPCGNDALRVDGLVTPVPDRHRKPAQAKQHLRFYIIQLFICSVDTSC